MRAIIGLGNPEDQHQKTRHNVGFRVIDILANQLDITLTTSPKLFSLVGKNNDWLLAKPQTYMNNSGQAVQAILHFYKLTPSDLIVIHDDLDIPFGFFKIQKGTGPKAHNGLLSIYEALHSKDFIHVRIGVESREQDRSMPGKNYVLSSFTDEEENRLQTVIGQAVQELLPLSKGN
ncbi:MAG: aminoacyl-tRNA hydrolase [Candidatus Pacebacteria bacterium RIFOXYB1_FULL_39_46]|nr:MAG: aminoacyl-tRNA hydrolase [Candidatus Pacebacteria bacterium RIFOXYA1_FULL_38_18]OGJ38077.1 MAG: aminoacyl-tRNA hydrolase [Candidatus Pacebacteria bacterium RIFOXYB1_FULL_39_46]OGJ39700.1 MAG: aminoacyl-tRNA hydrolase [Candidatus Pacebacteria bacterium RIFOXYC1_FULL_39_21]OGJ39829.1 MAG: aminoacyl-tRNA hydrolase [Candidatus Pacebacteria bacterium RIFOXYD1_FULL_39_27]